MAGHGHGQFIRGNAASVIGHLNEFPAGFRHDHLYAGCMPASMAFSTKLLDDRCRPLNDLARGDLRGDLIG